MMEEKKINEIHAQLIKNIMSYIKERGIEELTVFSEEICLNGKLK